MPLKKDDPAVLIHYRKLATEIPFPVPLQVLSSARLLGAGPADATPVGQVREYLLMLHGLSHFADDFLNRPRALPVSGAERSLDAAALFAKTYPGIHAAMFVGIFPLLMPDLFGTYALLPTLCAVMEAYVHEAETVGPNTLAELPAASGSGRCRSIGGIRRGTEVIGVFSGRLEQVKSVLLEHAANLAGRAAVEKGVN